MGAEEFLPVNMQQARARGWQEVDFVLLTGDAYVDHPSFGAAVIGRVLEAEGYRVGIVPQPDVYNEASVQVFGVPKLAFLVSGGVVDSMVAHYTSAKRRRAFDEYSPGGAVGKRPDRVVDVYTRLVKKVYPQVPVIVGGVEASLRRFAHYDYWDDEVRPSILLTSGADAVSFGMGERTLREAARCLSEGLGVQGLQALPGIAYLTDFAHLPETYVECASYTKVRTDKAAYARACCIQLDNQDPQTAKPVVQKQEGSYLVQNPPAQPLAGKELDAIYALPYTRRWHPMYDAKGGVPALEEVAFSLTHNRGCFGGCNFCAITLHQGRRVTTRTADSVVEEAERLTRMPGFKGYIHDVGGPTANFRFASCARQQEHGMCSPGKKCLAPSPCAHLQITHNEYLDMLRRIRALPGVKKVFIRSGIRYDYLIHDKDERFFKELVEYHVSGQLKVAPEHCSASVLKTMGKPAIETYERFAKRFYELCRAVGKEQYLVPYLISSHPGSTLKDAVMLAEWLHKNHMKPEQVQDFYPTPGTVSTCMYYTGIDPFTGQTVYVARSPHEKAMQRALLQPRLPKNRALAAEALRRAGRADLIATLVGGGFTSGMGAQAPQQQASNVRRENQRKNAHPKQQRGASGKKGTQKPTNNRKGAAGLWQEERNSRSKKKKRS